MPALFGRRYLRKVEAVGRTEQVLGGLILVLVAAVVVAFVVQVLTNRYYLFNVDEAAYQAADRADGGESPFPAPDLEGWRAPRRVERFTAANLYAKIDGRADVYIKFHVVSLTFGSYSHQDDASRAVDVYWYDMGQPANALGVYKSEEAPDATSVAVGRAGYQSGGAVFFCKGSSYVQVLPSRAADADAGVALRIAQQVAERIEEK